MKGDLPDELSSCLIYNLRECEIRAGSREVLVRGETQKIEPKAFDLLVCLIENRRRVVPKNELLAGVWKRSAISESVLARTVMKARIAINDNDPERPLIRTAHRIGYQFTGDCWIDTVALFDSPVARTSDCKIAILPFENNIARSQFSWVPLGMMSQLGEAMSANPRIQVASAAATLHAMEKAGSTSGRPWPRTVLQALGVHHVVRVAITEEDGRYEARCELFSPTGSRILAPLHGLDLADLLPQLDELISKSLFDEKDLCRSRAAPRDSNYFIWADLS